MNKKNTVNSFTHPAEHSEVLRLVKRKYGIKGYAFYFILQELLCSSFAHSFGKKDSLKWMSLLSETEIEEGTAEEMLNYLASLGFIDIDLWNKKKTIWSDMLIDDIKKTYIHRRRNKEIPVKPSIEGVLVNSNKVNHSGDSMKHNEDIKTKVESNRSISKIGYDKVRKEFVNISEDDMERWQKKYPYIDVEATITNFAIDYGKKASSKDKGVEKDHKRNIREKLKRENEKASGKKN